MAKERAIEGHSKGPRGVAALRNFHLGDLDFWHITQPLQGAFLAHLPVILKGNFWGRGRHP
jgi:hypothetical protein